MTLAEIKAIEGITTRERNTANRLFWAAAKKNVKCSLEDAANPNEALSIIRATFRDKQTDDVTSVEKVCINLNVLTIEELENLLNEIPVVIAEKKAKQLAEIDKQIEALKEQKKALSK